LRCTLYLMAMFTTRRSITQSLFLSVVMKGMMRGGVSHKMFTMRWIRCTRLSIMVVAILIGTTKTSKTTTTGRVAYLPGVVCMHGSCGPIIIICKFLVRHSFHFKVFIVFEIFCTCNIEGEMNISGCIGYKFLRYTLFTNQYCLHAHCICVLNF
jgi:hypothetical protein